VRTFLAVLPLAFVMIAGPQIISAVFLATSLDWRRNSAAFLAGALCSITLVVSTAYFLTRAAKGGDSSSASGTTGHVIDAVVLGLLLVLALYVFHSRKKTEPPKWMGKLQSATPSLALKLGFLLLGFLPSDLLTSITVGTHLSREGDAWWHCLPFIGLTLLLLALPVILVVLMGARAKQFLPRVRDWMSSNSWIVSEVVIVFFMGITVSSLAG
jgi:Sap, sulfolipid-1-addressing protein